MKTRLIFLFLILISSTFAETLNFTVVKNPFLLSTFFELISKEGYEGRIVKESLHLLTTYDLYDKEGWYEAQGICRPVSIEVIRGCAREIDIYDDYEKKIGFIGRQELTTDMIRYELCNPDEYPLAVACLDYYRQGFSILDKQGDKIAFLKKIPSNGSVNDWEMNVFKPGIVDMRCLKIFAAFVVDCQGFF